MARVRSQIADLSGVRRGHVSIACAQALMPYFLPRQIEGLSQRAPAVHVQRPGARPRSRRARARRLFRRQSPSSSSPPFGRVPDRDDDPPAGPLRDGEGPTRWLRRGSCGSASVSTIRSRCPPSPDGLRFLLQSVASAAGAHLEPAVESDSYEFLLNYAAAGGMISFQIPVGVPDAAARPDLASRLVDPRDIPPSLLHMGQLRGRVLPIAAARFADRSRPSSPPSSTAVDGGNGSAGAGYVLDRRQIRSFR